MKNRENLTLVSDQYEYTMSQVYLDNNLQDTKVVFDVFYRVNPLNSGYSITAGLDEIIDYIKNFRIGESEKEFLRKLGFKENMLKYLKNMKFTGDIWAIPDGTMVFPNEPIITVRANAIEAQVIETALLAAFNHASLITTATKRIVNEAGPRAVMEFGARRSSGIYASVDSSKYGYLGGCAGTSNLQTGYEENCKTLGTMAHSFIEMFDSEYEAFLAYAKTYPNDSVFLIDTYDTLRSGLPNAIKVMKEYLIPNGYNPGGIRIDSGDLAYLTKEARRILDSEGLQDVKICVSNGLKAETIRDLIQQGACIDSFGVGDNIASPMALMGGVYKLVCVIKDGKYIPKIKISEDPIKTINPGFKTPYRFYDKNTGKAIADVITLHNEIVDLNGYTLIDPIHPERQKEINNYTVRKLQVPIFEGGELVYENPSLKDRRDFCISEFETLYPEITRLMNPEKYIVDLSETLLELKTSMIKEKREAIRTLRR